MRRQAAGCALLALLSGCADLSDQEAEALYQRRFAHYKAGEMTALYDVMEPVAGAPTAPPLAQAARTSIAGDALSAARAYAQRNSSTAFLVWQGGQLQDQTYFMGTLRSTLLNALSLAKPLAVLAIGRAMALGTIASLDQKVGDFISEWRGTAKGAMTIDNLLHMQSGLQAQDFSMDPASVTNRVYLSPFHDRVLIQDYPLTDPPGTRFAYSNAAADLVAIIIERASGRRYAQFLSEELLRPLQAMGGTLWLDRPGGTAHAGCCIQLPAETWLRLGILVLQDGVWNGRTLVDPAFMRQMTTPVSDNRDAGMMGIYLGTRFTPRRGFTGPGQPGPQVLHGEPYLAPDLVLFDGNADQVLYIVPSAGLVALRMGNPPPKQPEWDNSVIPNLLLRGLAR